VEQREQGAVGQGHRPRAPNPNLRRPTWRRSSRTSEAGIIDLLDAEIPAVG
jgi:hypothetical protein